MRYSASTRSRSPDGPLLLRLLVVGEDHPKACTGRRLLRLGLALPLGSAGPRGVLLDPYAAEPLSRADLPRARRGGLVAIDCSWNRLSARGAFPEGARATTDRATRRRLPWLYAGNAQHYGRLGQLNTVEAFAGARYVLGDTQGAAELGARISGVASFLKLNERLLESYRGCATTASILRCEGTMFAPSG